MNDNTKTIIIGGRSIGKSNLIKIETDKSDYKTHSKYINKPRHNFKRR